MSVRRDGGAVRKTFSSPLASVFVIAVTVLWTVPTLGLLVTSLRPKRDVTADGWWNALLRPDLGLDNYHTVLFEGGSGVSTGLMPFLVNSLAISVPATLFPLALAAMAAYALAWVRFRGSDTLFFVVFALQVVPMQMALIPLLQLFSGGAHLGSLTLLAGAGPQGHLRAGVAGAHHVRAAAGDLPAAQLHRPAAPRPDGGGGGGRRLALQDLPFDRAAALHARAGLVRDLPVPLGLERPAGGAHLHAAAPRRWRR